MAFCQPGGGSEIRVNMKVNGTWKEKTAVYLFFTGVVLETLLVLVDKSAYTNPLEGQIFRITFLLFFAKVCLTRYSVREYAVMVFFLAIGTISYFVTGRNEIVRVVMFIAAGKDINMTKCLKMVFWMTLAGCLGLILLSLFGILGTVFLTCDYGRGSVETRYVLGMGHPNALQCMVCVLTMLGLYLYHEKWKWYYYALLFLTNGFFFLLTDSKTGFLVSVCTIILFFLASRMQRRKVTAIFSAGNIGIFVGSVLISVLSAKDAICLFRHFTEGAYNTKIKFYIFLNQILTGRIHALVETSNNEGTMETWHLFSSPESQYYFDMGWVRLFYWYGVIPAILGIFIMGGLMVYFARERKLKELVLFSMIALYTVIEAHFISVYIGRNYLLFVVAMYWWRILENPKEDPESMKRRSG